MATRRKKSATRKRATYPRKVVFRKKKSRAGKRKGNPKARAAMKRAISLLSRGKARTMGSALKAAWAGRK